MSIEHHAGLLRGAFDRAVAAVRPAACLPAYLPSQSNGRTFVISVGKAAAAMAEVAAARLNVDRGLVIFPDGHGPTHELPRQFELIEASHPIPDERSVRAAQRALEMAGELGSGDRLIALISGGGSALLAAPVEGVSLADKQALTRSLLASGATIADINCVRQCLSRVKGGRLAKAAGDAEVLTFVISDVPGDDIRLVASGPTLPSSAKPHHACAILDRCDIPVSDELRAALDDTASSPVAQLPNAAGSLVAGPRVALTAAADFLKEQGYRPVMLGEAIEGEAAELAKLDAGIARARAEENYRLALIAGGEATVRLQSDAPAGGRNLEYALALALVLDGHPRISALAADSDGIDGTTPVAGAIIGPGSLAAMRAAGIDPSASLADHDAYRALASIDALVVTGPTRTNVNDIRLILIDPNA